MRITISGNPGSGKGTLGKYLAEKFNLKFYSMGDLRREMARKRGMNINELNKLGEKEAFTDKEVDDYLKELSKEENIIVDGRMAFHFIPSIKIFLKVDLREGAKRILKRNGISEKYRDLDETCTFLEKRMVSDTKRYKKYYGIDVFDLNNYDIIIDTTDMSINEAKENIVKTVEKFISNQKDKSS